MRHEIEVYLAVSAGTNYFLMIEEDGKLFLPHTPRGRSSRYIAGSMFHGLLGFDAEPWIPLRQVAFIDDKSEQPFVVLYGATMPEATRVQGRGARWATLEEIALSGNAAAISMILRSVNYIRTHNDVDVPESSTEEAGQGDEQSKPSCPPHSGEV